MADGQDNGATQREIARVTGISRHTIRFSQKQSTSLDDVEPPATAGDVPARTAPPWPPPRSPGAAPSSITSACEPNWAFIESQLKLTHNVMAVYQDLVDQFGFDGAYNSVKRFAAKLRKREPQQFDRLSLTGCVKSTPVNPTPTAPVACTTVQPAGDKGFVQFLVKVDWRRKSSIRLKWRQER
ncbi:MULTISPECIES: hypothetical protein [unclassified Variovorax]|uniref:hypothetical protein n=1 Tax=unclassified Variovorax TaxID=663243 RepID=UPI0032E5EC04